MDKIQEYRRAAFGEMIAIRAHNHMMERLLCAIDNNEPCRDLDQAVKRLQLIMREAQCEAEDAVEGLSSVEIMEASSPLRIAELQADKDRLDWLEQYGTYVEFKGYGADDRWVVLGHHDGMRMDGTSVREAIDGAMKGR